MSKTTNAKPSATIPVFGANGITPEDVRRAAAENRRISKEQGRPGPYVSPGDMAMSRSIGAAFDALAARGVDCRPRWHEFDAKPDAPAQPAQRGKVLVCWQGRVWRLSPEAVWQRPAAAMEPLRKAA